MNVKRKAYGGLLVCLSLLLSAAPASAVQGDLPGAEQTGDRPRICLALGGGGARGMAHVGVLRVLEQLRVPVDCVAGTSIGSIVGGLYALGLGLDEIEEVALTSDWPAIFSDKPPRQEMSLRRRQDDREGLTGLDVGLGLSGVRLPRGLIQGQNLLVFLRRLSRDQAMVKDFDHLPIPYRAVATDLETGETVVIRSGDLPMAVRASVAVPAIFSPAQVDGRLLVDGGLFANVPVEAARAMGADVVIAVDVGYPVRDRADLGSALEIADQTVTLMMRKGTEEQLALLGEADVVIVPDLGNTSSAAFDEAGPLMVKGEAAARSVQDRLARYSLDEQQYMAHLQARHARAGRVDTPMVREVHVNVDGRLTPRALSAWMTQEVDRPLDIDSLERDMQRIYGLGIFESVDYSLLPLEDGAQLNVRAHQKSWGPNYLNLSLNLEDRFQGDSGLLVGAQYTMTQVNPLAAEWRHQLLLGSESRLASEFYQPLSYGSPYFVAVGVSGSQRYLDVYETGVEEALGKVRRRNFGVFMDLGKQFHDLGELRMGLFRGQTERRFQVGDPQAPGLQNRDFELGEFRLKFEHDSFDTVPFARSGTLLRFESAFSRSSFGAASKHERHYLRSLSAFSRGATTAMLGLELGTHHGLDRPEIVEPFLLGGFLRLSGLNRNELTGHHLALGKLVLMNRLDEMSFGSIPLYLGGSMELGNVWPRPGDISLDSAVLAGSLFIAADTLLGPVYAGTGLAEGGASSVYLAIGYRF